MKKRVTGIQGVFIKAMNIENLGEWHRDWLCIPSEPNRGGWTSHLFP